jgi:hypothetical protein
MGGEDRRRRLAHFDSQNGAPAAVSGLAEQQKFCDVRVF